MNPRNTLLIALLTGFALCTMGSCNHSTPTPSETDTIATDTLIDESPMEEPVADDPMPLPEELSETSRPEPEAPAPAPKSTPKASKTETLYISTHGAQGEVWGHVTMTGNTGKGTIHDADENTLSIRVSRHGNELYGTDQNGRQYVFKL